jgi:hypothetical protein
MGSAPPEATWFAARAGAFQTFTTALDL